MAVAEAVRPRKRDRARPLATRVFVGIALAALGLGCLWAGQWAFAALVVVTAGLAWREWARLHGMTPLGTFMGVLSTVGLGTIAVIAPFEVFITSFVGIILLHSITLDTFPIPGLSWPRSIYGPKVRSGLIYLGLPAAGLIWLDAQPLGQRWIEWTVGIVCAADIAAFTAGRLIGGPRLWPRLSPNKTFAGLIGALAAAAAASAILGPAVGLATAPALAIGFALGGLAMAGDLFESWMKRRVGRKDSGSILPGHGGILDRLDGLVPVAIVVPAGVWAFAQ